MSTRLFSLRAGLVLSCLAVRAAGASSHALFDLSDLDLSSSILISDARKANPFEVPLSRVDTVTVWLAGFPFNPEGAGPPGFSGLSWAILSDDKGPDTSLFSGTDLAPEFEDTGLTYVGQPVYRTRIHLDGRPNLFGFYWLVLREGAWEAPTDDSDLNWMRTGTPSGNGSYTGNLSGTPSWSFGSLEFAMVVEGDPLHYYQGDFSTTGSRNVSDAVVGADFTLAAATTLGSLEVWLSDNSVGSNGQLDEFDGTLSWAIYSNDGGVPDAPLHTGHDSSPILTDTGLQDSFDTDIVRARIELAGRPTLPAGTYWLVLHEGTWLQAYDGDPVYWQRSTSLVGNGSYSSDTETSPVPFTSLPTSDFAFVLFEDELFASGFEAGVACAWSSTTGGALCP